MKRSLDSVPYVALSVRQPYAHLILQRVKRFEARSWQPRKLGTIAIHASQAFAAGWRNDHAVVDALEHAGLSVRDARQLPTSAIIGAVEVVSIVQRDDLCGHERIAKRERSLCASDGWTFGLYLWRLERPIRFSCPIECGGRLLLWTIPNVLVRRISQSL